jgi:transposase
LVRWFGLTPKEHSSGHSRKLGRISKQGDKYLRMLLIHGARSVLRAAAVAAAQGKQLEGIRAWGLDVQRRTNHNKAACALANKMARIAYACLRDHALFGQLTRMNKKIDRQSFNLPEGMQHA